MVPEPLALTQQGRRHPIQPSHPAGTCRLCGYNGGLLTTSNFAMHIWVDADACPAVIKDILFRVAERLQLNVTLVANQLMRVPGSRFVRALQVPAGADAADAEIVERVSPGDIVVTGDIPLAALVLEKGGLPLNPRGDWYTKDTIAQQLSMRAFMEELRGSGVDTGGPAAFNHADRQSFANALDRELARRKPRSGSS